MSSSRTSRVLFATAVVVVAAFALLELPRRRAERRALDDARRLFPPFGAAVDQVEIVRPDERVLLRNDGGRWIVVEPVADAAELSRVATLIDAIARGAVERNLGAPDGLDRHGLSPPSAVVTLTAAGDTLAHLELGSLTVDGAFVFARRSDGALVLAPPAILTAATLPASAYRDQNLVRFEPAEVASFSARPARRPAVHWYRRAGDAWFTVIGADTVAGDSVAVPAHLRRFRGMRVRRFVTTPDTAGAFATAGLVTLRKRAPAPPVTIRFSARPDGAYWARTDGAARVVEVEGDVPEALDASPALLRDRRLLHFDPARARRIRVVTPDTSVVLVRAGDNWALPNPALGRVDPRAAVDLVRTLRTLCYRRVTGGEVRSLEPATFTLVVAGDGDTILDEMRARPAAGSWLATSRSSPVLVELPAEDVHVLIARLRRLRAPPGR